MKAHIADDVEIRTEELKYRGKVYNVAFSLKVMNKLNKLDDDTDEVESIPKIITWLINDSIDRDYILTGEKGEKVSEEEVGLLIGSSNLAYYKDVLEKAMRGSIPEQETAKTDDGNEIVLTEEMIEMFGEPEKN